ncbi:helix-turn-helix transcriptional regulator [Cryptosporangium sp. NPDC048952]|uniref:helix-turn-helix transcriptional regulator n=1 Tax=Cryptosporangium sp. NPDC048952 TaxID=3363961 RepID=UPI00371E4B34
MPEREPLWNIDTLSQFLDVPVATIYKWRKTGDGPAAFRVGRHLRWRDSEVQAWLARQRDEVLDDRWQVPTSD